jgi:hypothetical protein
MTPFILKTGCLDGREADQTVETIAEAQEAARRINDSEDHIGIIFTEDGHVVRSAGNTPGRTRRNLRKAVRR